MSTVVVMMRPGAGVCHGMQVTEVSMSEPFVCDVCTRDDTCTCTECACFLLCNLHV